MDHPSADLEKLLRVVEDLLRIGQGRKAREEIKSVDPAQVSRKFARPMASAARRAGVPHLALKYLFPIIKAPNSPFPTTPGERAEYAAALASVGATEEALRLLSQIDASKCPEAFLYEAFVRLTQWNYKATIVPLEKYVNTPTITDKQQIVGKINLAGALIFERIFIQAEVILESLLEETKAKGLLILYGNVLELAAQSAILQSRWSTGERHLFEAQSIVRGMGKIFEFFVRKWIAILAVMRTDLGSRQAVALEDLRKIRVEAKERRHWESVRDCDYFECLANKDTQLALRLFFGTPFDSFRRRLVREFGKELLIPNEYYYGFSHGMQPTHVVETSKATLATRSSDGIITQVPLEIELSVGGKALLRVLSSDFYSPFRLPALFSHLFPNEPFNPFGSEEKISVLLKELQEWFFKNHIPMYVEEEGGFFRLGSEEALALRVPRTDSTPGVTPLVALAHAK